VGKLWGRGGCYVTKYEQFVHYHKEMSSPENSLSDDGKDDDLTARQVSDLGGAGGPADGAIFKDAVLTEFDEVGRQVGAGVYWMKRCSRVMKKFADLEAQFAAAVVKLIDHEMEKAESTINVQARQIYKDQMPRTWNAIQQFHGAFKDIAMYHSDHSKQLLSCAKPIKHFFKNTQPKLLKQVTKIDTANKAITAAKDKAVKQKAKVMASYDTGGQTGGMLSRGVKGLRASMSGTFGEQDAKPSLTSPGPAPQPASGLKIGKILSSVMGASTSNLLANPASPPSGGVGSLDKKSDESASPRRDSNPTSPPPDDKTMAMAKDYMKMIDQINQMQEKFLTEDLVEANNFFEITERARIEILSSQLGLVVNSYGALRGKFEDTMERLNRQLSMVSTQADLYNFVNLVERVKGTGGAGGKSKTYAPVDYDLPFVKENTKKGRKESTSSEQAGIFALTLYELIKVEREIDPQLKVPKIFTVLLNAVKDLGGFKTEGIFRISAAKQNVDALRMQIIEGDYTINTKDAHIPANLLKEWMRGMPEPLFTHNVYDECIKVAKEECQDPQVYMDIMSKLHEVNRHVIYQLIEMILELTKPEHSEVTKMNLKNLAIVFAPSFLRYKGNDPMMILKNNVLELQFVMNLVTLYNPDTFKAVKTKGKKHHKHERTKSQEALAKFDTLVADHSADNLEVVDSKDDIPGDADDEGSTRKNLRSSESNLSLATKTPTLSGAEDSSINASPNPGMLDLRLSSELPGGNLSEPGTPSPNGESKPAISFSLPSPIVESPRPEEPKASPPIETPSTPTASQEQKDPTPAPAPIEAQKQEVVSTPPVNEEPKPEVTPAVSPPEEPKTEIASTPAAIEEQKSEVGTPQTDSSAPIQLSADSSTGVSSEPPKE
jgi:hypothetical protein